MPRGARLGARFKGMKYPKQGRKAYKGALRRMPSLGRSPMAIRSMLKILGVKY